jgi:hypothetical protein
VTRDDGPVADAATEDAATEDAATEDRATEPDPVAEPEARQPLEPLETNEVAVVAVGMTAWLVALILLATVFHHRLERHHATWWLWSCALGLALGVYGLRFARRRRRG